MNNRLLGLLLGAIHFVLGIVEVFLSVRFLLKIFGANPANAFTAFIYESTTPLLDPFRNMFPTQTFHGQYILEFSTLFAVIIYALAAYLLAELASWIGRDIKE